jgi:STE24 endopeptidase
MLVHIMASLAVSFDPETATQAYLATVKGAARAKSDNYFEGGYWLILWGALVAILSDFIILQSRMSARFRDWAARVAKRRWLVPALYVIPYTIVGTLIVLPWTIYTGFIREKQYDLMNQSFADWFIDLGKGLGIGIVSAAIMFVVIFAVIRNSPKLWWLWGALATSAMLLLTVMISPIYIAPLFNKYTEMQPGPVRDRIVGMATANHVPAEHIYVADNSKQTKRISANVSGIGPTVRITLNDNLLNRTTPAQTASVMGHELGHYVLGHITRMLVMFTALIILAFWLLSRIAPSIIARRGQRWGVEGVADPAVIPLFGILVSIFMLVLTPVFNTIIRTNEIEADAFGLEAAREPDGFAQTALALSEYRKLQPGPIEEALFFDHPSGETRIRMAMKWKAAHLAAVQAKEMAEAK